MATTVSRVTGFLRDWSLAFAAGVALIPSAYRISNNIPNMVYELVAGGILSSVFIPIFMQRMELDSEEDAWHFASSTFNIAMIVLGVIALIGTVFAEPFVRTQTIGVDAAEVERFLPLATFFFRFFAIQVVLYGATAVITGVLNSYRHFLWPAVGPIFNNIVVIATILFGFLPLQSRDPELALTVLAIGTTAGVFAQMAVQIPSLVKVGLRYSLVIDLKHPATRTMGRKMLATLLYVATNLVGVSLRNAASLKAGGLGGPAAVSYAWMFYQLPYGIFAVAVATAFVPELSAAAGVKDLDAFKQRFREGMGATALLMLPMAAMLVALAPQLITLLASGKFTLADVPIVAGVLRFWGLGVFSFAAYTFTLRSFYALQDARTPMITNVFATTLQIALYSALTLGIAGWSGFGLSGIGLADAVAYSAHVCVLLFILRRKIGPLAGKVLGSSVARVAVAATAGGMVAWGVAALMTPVGVLPGGFLLQLLAGGALGLLVAFGGSALLRVPEMRIAKSLAGRALGRFLPKGTS